MHVNPEDRGEELADVAICLLGLAMTGVDLQDEIGCGQL
jgi:hypothetical protein